MAPFTPFLAESIYQELREKMGLKEESVHLRVWPSARPKAPSAGDRKLLDGMAEVRRLAAFALAERAKAGIKVRQPLAKLKVKSGKLKAAKLFDVIADEVNVKTVLVDSSISGDVELDITLTAELREEGLVRELIRNIQEMRRDEGLRPHERIRIQLEAAPETLAVVERWKERVQNDTNAGELLVGGKRTARVGRETTIEGIKFWIGIR